jgi:hypothetical protein
VTVCEQLGGWTVALSLADIPERVLERARLQTAAVLAAPRRGARGGAAAAAAGVALGFDEERLAHA